MFKLKTNKSFQVPIGKRGETKEVIIRIIINSISAFSGGVVVDGYYYYIDDNIIDTTVIIKLDDISKRMITNAEIDAIEGNLPALDDPNKLMPSLTKRVEQFTYAIIQAEESTDPVTNFGIKAADLIIDED